MYFTLALSPLRMRMIDIPLSINELLPTLYMFVYRLYTRTKVAQQRVLLLNHLLHILAALTLNACLSRFILIECLNVRSTCNTVATSLQSMISSTF